MLKPLTSLRFVFAIMVFLYHLGGLFTLQNQSFLQDQGLKQFIEDGFLGVSFFFILSGFILSYNYKERFNKNEINKNHFFLARIFRIYPLHILTFSYMFLLMFTANYDKVDFWLKVFSQLTLTHSFVPLDEYFFGFNGVSWSISNELFFYLLFPFIVGWIKKYPKLMLFSLLIPIVWLFLDYDNPNGRWLFYINPLFRVFDFLLGVFLHDLYQRNKDTVLKKSYFSLLEVMTVLMFFGFYLFRNLVPYNFRWSLYYWIPMFVIIYVFSFQKGKISEFLSKKWFLFLGEISFAFYMVHQLIIVFLGILQNKIAFTTNGYQLILVAFFVSLLVSAIIHVYIEKPINSYLRKRFIKK